MTLNQLADSVANAINQPFNHELRERIKDLFKEKFATFIRRSVQQHGIDNTLLLSYTTNIVKVDKYNKPIDNELKQFKLRTEFKVPTPVRFANDAPFTYVGTDDGLLSFPYRNEYEATLTYSFFSTGEFYSYYLSNGYIFINDKPNNRFKGTSIKIESIFESPEEVINIYNEVDGQDTQLPIPLDIINLARVEIMQLVSAIPTDDIAVDHEK